MLQKIRLNIYQNNISIFKHRRNEIARSLWFDFHKLEALKSIRFFIIEGKAS